MANLGLTNGWDTVYAIRLTNVNKSIEKRPDDWPSTASGTSTGATARYDLSVSQLSNWRVGSAAASGGGMLNMNVDIVTGTLTRTPTSGAPVTTSLNGLTASVELGLGWVASAVDPTRQLQPTDLNVIAITPAGSLDATSESVVKSMLKNAFAADHAKFKASLAAVDIGAKEAQGTLAWLLPTDVSYAVSVPPQGTPATLENTSLAVLAMTENRQPTNLTQEVSGSAIPGADRGGFNIHRRLFLEKMVRPGMPLLCVNAKEADFELYNDNKGVRNKVGLDFPTLNVPESDGSHGRDVSPTIPARDLSIDIEGSQLVLRMRNFSFVWQAGVNVKIDYESRSSMSLSREGNIELVEDSTTTTPVVEVENWVNVTTIIAGVAIAIAGAAIGAGISAAVEGVADDAAQVAGRTATRSGTSIAMQTITTTGTSDAAAAGSPATRQMATAALTDVAAAGGQRQAASAPLRGFFSRNALKIKAALIGAGPGAIVGGVIAAIPLILKAMAEGRTADIPTLDTFATTAVAPVTWPDQDAFKLSSATLNDALQLGGDPFPNA
jgi:hypothetical protein